VSGVFDKKINLNNFHSKRPMSPHRSAKKNGINGQKGKDGRPTASPLTDKPSAKPSDWKGSQGNPSPSPDLRSSKCLTWALISPPPRKPSSAFSYQTPREGCVTAPPWPQAPHPDVQPRPQPQPQRRTLRSRPVRGGRAAGALPTGARTPVPAEG